ncbi:MAG: 16S rRNA (guanine(527)-N(7))-methyltransferase RsmG [Candidatus Cryptobacteroides sp.]
MEFAEFESLLKTLLPEADAAAIDRFRRMEALYRDWNAKINVISRKDIDHLYDHHILHSLCIALFLKFQEPDAFRAWLDGGLKVLDLGCGGGFPGIPLATLFPGVQFTLCDSIGKKITVAREVASSLGLENTECVNARAESLAGPYDYVVSRAVTSLDNFLPWVRGKYRRQVLCLKGGDLAAETAEAMGKLHLPKGSVGVWRIESVLSDEYFCGKNVVWVR